MRAARTLLRNAVLYDGRSLSAAAAATAVAVEDGRIAWTGSERDAAAWAAQQPVDRVVDAGGRLVTPAFVDAHAHLAPTGLAALGVDLSVAASLGEALERLAGGARTSTVSVLIAHGWDETGWPERRPPTRAEVDRAVGDRPAYVSRVDVHSAVASTALLRVLGDEVAGQAGWSEAGPLTRDAHHAVRGGTQRLLSRADREAAIRTALGLAAAAGIGLVHEIGAPHISPATDVEVIESLTAAGGMPEVVRYWGELGTARALALGCVGAAGDLCVDGALGSRTAALVDDYADRRGHRGHLSLTADEIAGHVVACTEAGLQAGFHVIGDRAVTETLTGFAKAAARVGADALRSAGHRLEHLEMVTPEQVATLASYGVTASVQPAFDARWGGPGRLYRQRVGERAAGMNPFRTMHEAGMALAFGSDTPVTPFDPWGGVRAAVRHCDPAQRLPVEVAFAAATAGGWRAAGRDGGTLAAGMPAHLAVWDGGVGEVADPSRPLPRCVLTLVAGEVAHAGGVSTVHAGGVPTAHAGGVSTVHDGGVR